MEYFYPSTTTNLMGAILELCQQRNTDNAQKLMAFHSKHRWMLSPAAMCLSLC